MLSRTETMMKAITEATITTVASLASIGAIMTKSVETDMVTTMGIAE